MTDDAFETACTRAVARLLLGNRRLKPGVALTGGGRLDMEGRVRLCRRAKASGTDIVHLEYGAGDDGRHALTGMTVFVVQGGLCHIQGGCRPWLSQAGARGVILPRETVRDHFRMAPGGIIRLDGRPTGDATEGMARADAWLARQLAPGTDAVDDGRYHVRSQAA